MMDVDHFYQPYSHHVIFSQSPLFTLHNTFRHCVQRTEKYVLPD